MAGSKGSFGLTPLTEDFSLGQPDAPVESAGEKRLRNLSKTKQWREVKDYIKQRQSQYSVYLPGYNPLMQGAQTEADWQVADCIIRELEGLILFIEGISGGTTK